MEDITLVVVGLPGADLIIKSDSRGEEGPAVSLLHIAWVKKPVTDGAFQGSYSLMLCVRDTTHV